MGRGLLHTWPNTVDPPPPTMSLSALGSGEKNCGLGSHILVLPFKDLFGTSKWKAVFFGGGINRGWYWGGGGG